MNNWYFFGKKIEKLSDYLEGNLDRSKESRIEGDLAAKANQQRQLKQAQILVQNLHQLPRVQPSESFDTVLRARLRKEAMQQSTWISPFWGWENWRVPAFAAAAAVILAIGFYAGTRTAGAGGRYSAMATKSNLQSSPATTAFSPQTAAQPVNVYVLERVFDSESMGSRVSGFQGTDAERATADRPDSIDRPLLRPLESDLTINQAGVSVQF